MKTYTLNQILWTSDYVQIPSDQRKYGTHHLVMLPDNSEEVQPQGVRSAILTHTRTKAPICHILIEASDEDAFQTLQNVLLTSKLKN